MGGSTQGVDWHCNVTYQIKMQITDGVSLDPLRMGLSFHLSRLKDPLCKRHSIHYEDSVPDPRERPRNMSKTWRKNSYTTIKPLHNLINSFFNFFRSLLPSFFFAKHRDTEKKNNFLRKSSQWRHETELACVLNASYRWPIIGKIWFLWVCWCFPISFTLFGFIMGCISRGRRYQK